MCILYDIYVCLRLDFILYFLYVYLSNITFFNVLISYYREYCANGNQHTQVCLLLVELSVDLSK